MYKMERTFFTIIFASLSIAAWAQQEKGTWSILPKIGLNMAGIVTYDHDTDVDGESDLLCHLILIM